MVCPRCSQRKAKRACPALDTQICTVCCGTKRIVEIACPADCIYLTSARSHPPAVEQRQQEHDRARLLPVLQGLGERQARIFLMLTAQISRHQGEAFQKIVDGDIAQAAEALAATLETAGRGIVYEHQPASLPAARLMAELKTLVAEVSKDGGSGMERDAAMGLRRIEQAARQSAERDPQSTAFQALLIRVLAPPGGSAAGPASPLGPLSNDRPESPRTAPASSLIIPGS